jgi:hypothetical protein
MTDAASKPEIVPFWNRLREISFYPAHPHALLTIGVLAVCSLAGYLPGVGFILDIVVWIAVYKYAFECLRATADGRLEPPELAVSVEDSLGWEQIKLQVIFVLLNMAAFFLLGPIGGIIVTIVLAIALPGAIMSLAMDQNLWLALSPATWFAILARIGWPYVAVAALYFVFTVSEHTAQSLVTPMLPPVVSDVVFHFIANYVIVATFHLMGYLIYQYHEEVGYEPAAAAPTLARIAEPDQALLDEAAQLVRDGEPEAAADALRAEIRGRGGSEAVHAQYRKILGVLGRRDEQLKHDREWIGVLLAQDKDRRAVDVARECLDMDPAFELANPDDAARVAQKAVDVGATQVALKLLSAFIKSNPKHRDVPRNALLAARVLAERMGKDDVARKLLDHVTERFPNDALAPEIQAYRTFLDKLATKPARA